MTDQLDHVDHWETLFNKKYLRWFHLQGKECTVEITKVERNVELTLPGGAKDKRPLVHFKGKEKPLVLNSTNAESIARALGQKVSEWVGQSITLYPTTTEMTDRQTRKRKTVGCIRIKPAK